MRVRIREKAKRGNKFNQLKKFLKKLKKFENIFKKRLTLFLVNGIMFRLLLGESEFEQQKPLCRVGIRRLTTA